MSSKKFDDAPGIFQQSGMRKPYPHLHNAHNKAQPYRSTFWIAFIALILLLFGICLLLIGQDLSKADAIVSAGIGYAQAGAGHIGRRIRGSGSGNINDPHYSSLLFDTRAITITNEYPYDISLYTEDGASAGAFVGNIAPHSDITVSASTGTVFYVLPQGALGLGAGLKLGLGTLNMIPFPQKPVKVEKLNADTTPTDGKGILSIGTGLNRGRLATISVRSGTDRYRVVDPDTPPDTPPSVKTAPKFTLAAGAAAAAVAKGSHEHHPLWAGAHGIHNALNAHPWAAIRQNQLSPDFDLKTVVSKYERHDRVFVAKFRSLIEQPITLYYDSGAVQQFVNNESEGTVIANLHFNQVFSITVYGGNRFYFKYTNAPSVSASQPVHPMNSSVTSSVLSTGGGKGAVLGQFVVDESQRPLYVLQIPSEMVSAFFMFRC